MAVIRQVKSKIKITPRISPVVPKTEDKSEQGDKVENPESVRTKKVCLFCESKKVPRYFDAVTLRRFMNDRGKISSRTRTGVCSKHQRRVSTEIKRARHLAMLPFSVRV